MSEPNNEAVKAFLNSDYYKEFQDIKNNLDIILSKLNFLVSQFTNLEYKINSLESHIKNIQSKL